jgi:error-prone DNA polymerase
VPLSGRLRGGAAQRAAHGFYAPAQIVRDLREHGVEVRPVDINHSDWDATLEPGPHAIERMQAAPRAKWRSDIRTTHALRLGFRKIKGLSESGRDADRHENETTLRLRPRPLAAHRLSPRIIERLADADAFGSLGLRGGRLVGGQGTRPRRRQGRRSAVVSGLRCRTRGLVDPQRPRIVQFRASPTCSLPPMPPGEEVVNDYRFLELSLRAHPASLPARRPRPARHHPQRGTARSPSAQRVSVSGLVTIRQRPARPMASSS